MALVVPAVLPTSRKDLHEKLTLIASLPGVTHVQIDVVDGVFATPASWPYNAPGELQEMKKEGEMLPHLDHLTYEIDLMCQDPLASAEEWLALGATRLTFHAESTHAICPLLETARGRYGSGAFSSDLISFGVALNLSSELALIEPCLQEVTYIQFMGIARIGQQGQPFDRRVLERVRIFHERHPDISVQIDGGVSLKTGQQLLSIGASSLVVGSAIVHADDPAAEVAKFEALESPFGV